MALALNKQLDLQTLGTAIMRHFAQSGGWYAARRDVQKLFIMTVGAATLLAAPILTIVGRRVDGWTRLALAGLVVLLVFVAVRAVSFHHVGTLIGRVYIGVTTLHLLELGGIAIIGSAALGFIRAGAGSERELPRDG